MLKNYAYIPTFKAESLPNSYQTTRLLTRCSSQTLCLHLKPNIKLTPISNHQKLCSYSQTFQLFRTSPCRMAIRLSICRRALRLKRRSLSRRPFRHRNAVVFDLRPLRCHLLGLRSLRGGLHFSDLDSPCGSGWT
jgi:hypothetical protein